MAKQMTVSTFFEEVLKAKLKTRYYWGATDQHKRIFLKVFEEKREQLDDGEYFNILLAKNESSKASDKTPAGERKKQIQQILMGAPAYGVLGRESESGNGKEWPEHNKLISLGNIRKSDGNIFIKAEDKVSVSDVIGGLISSSPEVKDVLSIAQSNIEKTTKIALIDARLGQGKFRDEVLSRWENRCAVTGVTTVEAIRASHIKAWAESSNEERLDSYNGLPLIATLDALFDRGLISFEADGTMIVSSLLQADERLRLGVDGKRLLEPLAPETAKFLEGHRQKWESKLTWKM